MAPIFRIATPEPDLGFLRFISPWRMDDADPYDAPDRVAPSNR
jgi:hypothetical protein